MRVCNLYTLRHILILFGFCFCFVFLQLFGQSKLFSACWLPQTREVWPNLWALYSSANPSFRNDFFYFASQNWTWKKKDFKGQWFSSYLKNICHQVHQHHRVLHWSFFHLICLDQSDFSSDSATEWVPISKWRSSKEVRDGTQQHSSCLVQSKNLASTPSTAKKKTALVQGL